MGRGWMYGGPGVFEAGSEKWCYFTISTNYIDQAYSDG